LPDQESNPLLYGGNTSGVGGDGAYDDYVVDITATQEAWDPGRTQD